MRKHTFNQIISSVTAGLSLLQMGLWYGYLSAVLPVFKAGGIRIALTPDNITWFVVLPDLGLLFTSLLVGWGMDYFGRLAILRVAFLSFLVAMSLILWATTPYQLYLASFLIGIGLIIGSTAPSLYVAEIAKPKIRGALGSIASLMNAGGVAIAMSVGSYLSFVSLTRAALVCPLLGLFLTFFIVESPYYHLIRSDKGRAAGALARVRNSAKKNETDVELESISKKVSDDLHNRSNLLKRVSHKSNRKSFKIVTILAIVRTAGGLLTITVFGSTSLPPGPWDPKKTMMVFAWLNVVSSVVGMTLVDRFGRKPLLIISFFGLTLVSVSLAIFYYFQAHPSFNVSNFFFMPHFGTVLFGIFFSIGIGPVFYLHRGELLSVDIKGAALAFATILASVIYICINRTYYLVEQSFGCYLWYAMFSIVNFFGLIFSITSVPETKGKTLEEIQNLLTS